MRNPIAYAAVSLLGLGVATAAHAQTIITRDVSGQPVETVITQQPVQTVQTTTETVRTARPGARPVVRKRVVTTTRQTVISQHALAPQPLYDVVTPPPVVTSAYPPPLYDTAAPVPTVDDTYVNAVPPVGTAIPTYRYVYEPDRILVVDPVTNIAIQAIPR
jgi:hypothetical protein